MGSITGGRVVFSRTVKTGDFENMKAEVELTFTAGDEDKYAELLDLASRQAKTKAHEMLGLSAGSVKGSKATAAPEAEEAPAKPAKKPGRPKAAKAEPEEADEDGVLPEDEAEEAEAEPSVSDEVLIAKISAHAKATGKKADIKKLIGEHSKTGQAAGIAPAKREAFLAALKKIKKGDDEDGY